MSESVTCDPVHWLRGRNASVAKRVESCEFGAADADACGDEAAEGSITSLRDARRDLERTRCLRTPAQCLIACGATVFWMSFHKDESVRTNMLLKRVASSRFDGSESVHRLLCSTATIRDVSLLACSSNTALFSPERPIRT